MIPVGSTICESGIGISISSVSTRLTWTDPDAMIEKVRSGRQPLTIFGVAR